ncbi:hypothetical protein [Streptomyces sp. AC602_WCS936]|nr:hypothetical protein [Streptomyces sp. AC602_WCS936]
MRELRGQPDLDTRAADLDQIADGERPRQGTAVQPAADRVDVPEPE